MTNLDESVNAALFMGRLGYSILPSLDHNVANPSFDIDYKIYQRRPPTTEELRKWFENKKYIDFGMVPRKKSSAQIISELHNQAASSAYLILKSFFRQNEL